MLAAKYPFVSPDVLSTLLRDRGSTLSVILTSKRLPYLIIGLGIAVRAAQYFANRSLWLDEAFLALNIVQCSFAELLRPLRYNQVAPLAFLMAEKLAVVCLGNHEYALRLFPFLAGIAAVPLFFAVARVCLAPAAALIALTLFALSDPLIYYASEVKQYSSDVAVTLTLYVLVLRYITQEISRGWPTIILGLGGAVAIWVSHSSIFILAGVGMGLAWFHLKRRGWRDLAPLLLVCMLWTASFAAVYFTSYERVETGQLEDYWGSAFMPLPPRSFGDVKWFGVAFLRIFDKPAELGSTVIALMVFSIGFAVMFSQDKATTFLLLSPLGFALIASGLRQYPFSGRLLLFMVPTLLIFIAAGLFQLLQQSARFSGIIKAVVIVFLVLPSIAGGFHPLLKKPHLREEIKPVLHYMQQHWQAGDTLYVYYSAQPAFQYYQERYGFSHVPYIQGINSRRNWRKYLDELETLRGRRRVWILLSHISRSRGIDEQQLFLGYLDQVGIRLSSVEAHGAEAYLYDLSQPSSAYVR